ncbi:PP2C family protein-serine/threonine phosphatase [Roseibium sp.]|uniref:PP2C family protein-serine/threonine phosphatase n=1 Tax=Roseibium sp. TaxID=1936156 RepID=UPI003B51AFC6
MTARLKAQDNLHGFAVGLTDVGRMRQENQDTFFIDEDLGVYAVMDGAGGMNDGARASGLVREALTGISNPTSAENLFDQFENHVIRAKDQIERAAEHANGAGMGTTIAALLTYGSHFVCLWAGDSRVYRFRNGRLEQLTTDHTEAQDLVDKRVLTPEEAKKYPRRHVITRAIGSGLDLELDAVSGNLRSSDRFMLCSDGLTGHLDDAVIETFLMNSAAKATAKGLIDGALESGGSDNVTVVIVDIDQSSSSQAEDRK